MNQRYGVEIKDITVEGFPSFRYAQWLHPLEGKKSFSARSLTNLQGFIQPGSVVIDIGAHTGDTTVPYAVIAGSNGMVIAFEPNKAVFEILEINAKINSQLNIVPIPFAITKEPGNFTFHYSDPDCCNGGFASSIEFGVGATGHVYPVEVTGVNLSSWLNENYPDSLKNISFIKVDAEGYDKEILKTFDEQLLQAKPFIQVEMYPALKQNERLEFFEVIASLGYVPFNLTKAFSNLENLAEFELSKAEFIYCSGESNYDILCLPL